LILAHIQNIQSREYHRDILLVQLHQYHRDIQNIQYFIRLLFLGLPARGPLHLFIFHLLLRATHQNIQSFYHLLLLLLIRFIFLAQFLLRRLEHLHIRLYYLRLRLMLRWSQ
jgi:hypothetical protein